MNRATLSALIKLSVFMVLTVFLTVVLASTIGNISTANGTAYKAVFADVTGLQKGDDIRVAGVEVGKVSSVKVHDRTQAMVGFGVTDAVHLKKDASIQVRYRNLIGQRYLNVSEGSSPDPLPAGATIPITHTSPALDLSVLLNGFKPLFQALTPGDVNRLSYEIIQTLQGEGGTVDSLLAHTASLTSTLADKDQLIGQVITNLDTVLTTVSERDGQLSELINQLQRLVTGLAADRGTIRDSLVGVDNLATALTGFLQPVRAPLKADISSLNSLAGQLADTKGVLDKELGLLPAKLNAVMRTATYGSWFNFYLCAADGTITLPTGQKISVSSLIQVKGNACKTVS